MNHLDTVRILPLILELFLSTHLRGLEENVVMIYPCFSFRAGPSQGCRSGQAAAHTCTKHGLSACCVLHTEDGQGPGLSCRISPELWAWGAMLIQIQASGSRGNGTEQSGGLVLRGPKAWRRLGSTSRATVEFLLFVSDRN